MKLASLFSGGKDSTYAIHLAKEQGHEVSLVENNQILQRSWYACWKRVDETCACRQNLVQPL